MKKSLLILASAFALTAQSQSSIMVTNMTNNTAVPPNAVIHATTIPADVTKIEFDIKNVSTATKSYNVKRYDLVLHTISATDSAHAHFCFASQCYGKGTFISPSPLTLNASQSASQVPGTYQVLEADLDETSDPVLVGLSVIKYTFVNTANANDSLQFTIRYNDASTSIKASEKDLSSIEIYPNPSSGAASLKVVSAKAFDSKVSVFNSLGEAVIVKDVQVTEGRNKINLETATLPSGIYFVSLKAGEKNITRRLIVNN